MARSAPSFSAFTAGEISPRLEGRTNLEKYSQGLSDLTNMVVMPHGGVTRRPGTEYLGEVKSSSVKTRLIPFQFKTSDTYILEFGNQIMRVFRNDLQVLVSSAKTITAITKANPGVLTSNSHGFSNGDEIFVDSIGGMTELNGRNYLVANSTTNTFTLTDLFGNAMNTTSNTTYTSGGTATEIYETATPYSEADLFDIRLVQSADTMYLVHPSYDIRTLTRSDHNNWTFATLSIAGSPSPGLSGANNRPSVVSFFEQRLVFGNTNNNPQTLFFSKNGDYDNFTVGTGDDDALIYTIASNQVNAIRYLSATRVLTVGTSGGEYVLTSTNDGPVTPTTTLIRKYSNYGTATIEPVQVADVTLFVQRGARKIREFKFVGDVNTGGYQAPDMTILAEHITKGGITQMAYQQEPDSVVWCIRADGTLLGLTYRREEEVVAWHKHVLGGVFGSGQAVVESIATLPTDSGEDSLFMIVKRTIDSVTKRYVEKLKPFDFGSLSTAAHFVDSGLSYSGSSTTTLTGLYHLRGETLNILANGSSHPTATVSNGGVTLNSAATTAAVGFSFTSSMQTLRIEAGSADGTSQGKPKRIHGITLRLFETVGLEVGNNATDVDRIPFRDSSMAMDAAVPLFTGDKDIEFRGGFDEDDRIYIQQSQALPMTILAFYPRLNTFDI
nr:putative phage protein p13 [uncultured Mediterranean phage uvMED]